MEHRPLSLNLAWTSSKVWAKWRRPLNRGGSNLPFRAFPLDVYFGLVLFASGVSMAYYIALPVTLRFLVLFGNEWFEPMLTAGPYFAFVTKLLLAFGVVFELPVVVMILSAMGLVTPTFLRRKRRHALVGITVLASILSPGDVITVTVMMMVPLTLLYEVSILLSAVIYRRRQKREAEFDESPPQGAVEAE